VQLFGAALLAALVFSSGSPENGRKEVYMLLKITRFVSLSLMGLGTGVSFSHLLQWKRKAELPGEVFVRVQKTPYSRFNSTLLPLQGAESIGAYAWHFADVSPLFTDNPRALIPGNRASGERGSRKPRGHEEGRSVLRHSDYYQVLCSALIPLTALLFVERVSVTGTPPGDPRERVVAKNFVF
jgi:hypothetical protein